MECGGGTLVSQVLSLVAGLTSSPGNSPRSPHTDSSSGTSGSPRSPARRPSEAPLRSTPPRSVPPRSGSPRMAAAARRSKLYACDHGCGFLGSHDAVLAHERTCRAAVPGSGGEGEGNGEGDGERGGAASEVEAGAGAGPGGQSEVATTLWPHRAPPSPTRQAPSTPPPDDRPRPRRSQSSEMVDRIGNLSMADLRTELDKRGLPPYGRREALQERLSGAMRQPAGS